MEIWNAAIILENSTAASLRVKCRLLILGSKCKDLGSPHFVLTLSEKLNRLKKKLRSLPGSISKVRTQVKSILERQTSKYREAQLYSEQRFTQEMSYR